MNRELKKVLREARAAERMQRRNEIHAKIEARRAERLQRIAEIHEAVRARKAARSERETVNTAAQTAAWENADRQAEWAARIASVPTIRFPADDPKYNSARV